MGEFSFENQALGAFMTYRLEGQETLDSLAMGMLSNNQIPGILPVSCVRTDSGQVVRFRISSLTALAGGWSGAITRQKLLTFLTSFCRAALECRDYVSSWAGTGSSWIPSPGRPGWLICRCWALRSSSPRPGPSSGTCCSIPPLPPMRTAATFPFC